jgi:hypothetical protein
MLRCSKEAIAACPDRKNCGCIEEATFTEGSECDEFNRKIDSHTLTNADRIRAMSDEELAVFLDTWGCCHHCIEHERLSDNRWFSDEKCDEKCAEHCLEWLKQPAKGE